MINKKSTSYINIILYIIYIGSIGFFAYTKSFGNIGLSLACLIGTFILSIFNKKYSAQLNDNLYITLVLFIMFSSLLGSCYRFYDIINHYDDFLHIWSGFISVSTAYSLLIIFNTSDIVNKINKYFIAIYLFVFVIAVAGLWEIMEFSIDTLFGLHTQAGGLTDTMIDMIDGLLGSIIMIPFTMKKLKKM